MEQWKQVLGYEGLYEVSSGGRVRSLDRVVPAKLGSTQTRKGKLLKVTVKKWNTYASATLSKDGRHGPRHIHGLVCEAFHGPRPEGMWVRHLNGDCLDNRAGNLAWGTPGENMADQYTHGTRIRGERHGSATLTEEKVRRIRDLARGGITQVEIARKLGLRQPHVSAVVRRQIWSHVA